MPENETLVHRAGKRIAPTIGEKRSSPDAPHGGTVTLFKGFGIGFGGSIPSIELQNYAKIAEEKDRFSSFWIAEVYHMRSAVALATAVSLSTRKIGVGVGLASPYTTHPALLAMEAATVQEISGGRFTMCVGVAKTGVKKHGLHGRPLTVLKETHDVIEGILSGKKFTYRGEVFNVPAPGSKLAFGTPSRVPVFMGATGPRLLKLAGQLYDGLIITYMTSTSFVRHAVEEMRKGALEAGKNPDDLDVKLYVLISLSEDYDKAVAAARDYLVGVLPRTTRTVLDYAGVKPDEVNPILDAIRGENTDLVTIKQMIDESLVKRLAIVGDAPECVERLKEYQNLGVGTPIAFHILGPDKVKAIGALARDVIPEVSNFSLSQSQKGS